MKKYWQQLTERERSLVCFAAMGLLIYLGYILVVAPLYKALAVKQQEIFTAKTNLRWMQNFSGQSQEISKAPVPRGKLLTVIAARLNAPNLHKFTYKLQQTGAGDLQLSFEKVPYNIFMQWLWLLCKEYHPNIKQLHVVNTEQAGLVSIDILVTNEFSVF